MSDYDTLIDVFVSFKETLSSDDILEFVWSKIIRKNPSSTRDFHY